MRPSECTSNRSSFFLFLLLVLWGAAGLGVPSVQGAPPTLTVVSPQDDAVIAYGLPVVVIFRVTEFNLTVSGGVGQIARPNEGHVEVLVDGSLAALVTDPTIVLSLDSGAHEIRLRLLQNDGTPVSPAVTATVTVIVTHGPDVGAPSIAITYPAEDEERGADTAVSFRLTNFALVDSERPVSPREGHIHVLLDGELYAEHRDYRPIHFSDASGV